LAHRQAAQSVRQYRRKRDIFDSNVVLKIDEGFCIALPPPERCEPNALVELRHGARRESNAGAHLASASRARRCSWENGSNG
jgi:hypothetical protein